MKHHLLMAVIFLSACTIQPIEEPSEYISCGCGCCAFDEPLENIASVECLSDGQTIQEKINKDERLTPEDCGPVGCSFPTKYVYCDSE